MMSLTNLLFSSSLGLDFRLHHGYEIIQILSLLLYGFFQRLEVRLYVLNLVCVMLYGLFSRLSSTP